MNLEERDPRKVLSKSFLVGADMCGERAWRDIHDPRPFYMTEKVAFGKVVDAALQVVIQTWNERATNIPKAIEWAIKANEAIEHLVSIPEVEAAIDAFMSGPFMFFEWTDARIQPELNATIPGIGDVNGHPDFILGDGTLLDIKTAARAKPDNAAAQSPLELGFYALSCLWAGEPVKRVGYITWVRTKSPSWQVLVADVDDRMLDAAWQRAFRRANNLRADANVNTGGFPAVNVSFGNGPKYAGLCNTCAHNPSNGGGCEIAEE